ncbi:hypothetical protein B7767_20775 [Streptomyces sp. 13-12-16]|nr:hypothetical protein B7767_20775 [Streptomyces sp. 13-12-16]
MAAGGGVPLERTERFEPGGVRGRAITERFYRQVMCRSPGGESTLLTELLETLTEDFRRTP